MILCCRDKLKDFAPKSGARCCSHGWDVAIWNKLRSPSPVISAGANRCGPKCELALLQSIEKGLRGFQIARLEPFAEPVVNRLKERQRLRGTALIA